MNLIQIAEERCANWDKPSGRCFGISAGDLSGSPRWMHPLNHCILKEGERCVYFEQCVIPGIPKATRITIPYYEAELQKLAKMAQRNQQVTEAKSPSATIGIKKSKSC